MVSTHEAAKRAELFLIFSAGIKFPPHGYSGMRQNSMRSSALTVLLLGLATTAMAGKVDPVYQHGGFAIRGYDAVAYYQQSAPVKGSSQFSYQ